MVCSRLWFWASSTSSRIGCDPIVALPRFNNARPAFEPLFATAAKGCKFNCSSGASQRLVRVNTDIRSQHNTQIIFRWSARRSSQRQPVASRRT